MKSGKERRSMERFALGLPSVISVIGDHKDSEIIELETRNICAGGAYFDTSRPLPVGTRVKIDLVLTLEELRQLEGKRTLIKVSGEVVRTEDEGMAIRFDKNYELVPLEDEGSDDGDR